MDYKILSIDETGKAHYIHPSEFFVVSGCVVREKHKDEIRRNADKIIYKYWGDKKIIFHSSDMFGRRGLFDIFEDENLESCFWNDFFNLIIRRNYLSFYIAVVNKENARKRGWQTKTIVEEAYKSILVEFSKNLKKTGNFGKVQSESSTDQDISLITVHSRLQRNGVGRTISGKDYFQLITSLSLVTKGNHDIETQLSDIIATVGRVAGNLKQSRKVEKMIFDEFIKKTKDKTNPSVLIKVV